MVYADVEKKHKERLGEAYDYQIEGLQDVENLIAKVKELQQVFSGTKDENDVVDVFKQLAIFKEDMLRWSSLEMPTEELEELLEGQIPLRVQEIQNEIEEDDGEAFCDIEAAYSKFKKNILSQKYNQSSQWVQDIAPVLDDFEAWPLAECERQLSKLKNIPAWIAIKDQATILGLKKEIEAKVDNHKDAERQRNESTWLQQIRVDVKEAKDKSTVHCEKLIGLLGNIPEYVSSEFYEEIDGMRKAMQSHIDEMHIDDIFERICNLSEVLRLSLIGQLRKKFAGIFSSD